MAPCLGRPKIVQVALRVEHNEAPRAQQAELDTRRDAREPWAVPRLPSLIAVALAAARPLVAQAPAEADLWRAAAGALVVPAALASGAAGTFWNPGATVDGRGTSAALEMVQTSSVVGLTGLVAAGSTPLGRALRIGLTIAYVGVSDLPRTSTSPDTEEGEIPVYHQLAAANFGVESRTVRAGLALALHGSAFDAERYHGFTLDAGVVVHPHRRLTLALSTHFLPMDLSSSVATDYFAGAEYRLVDRSHSRGVLQGVSVRYGAGARAGGEVEHSVGVGTDLAGRVHVDGIVTSESAYGQRALRLGMGVGLAFGRYALSFARGDGLNDLGAIYRLGLDVRLRS